MEHHKHVKVIHPTERWDSGASETLLVVITDLALPRGADSKEFADLRKWVESYRDKRYPNLRIEYRND